MPRNMSFALTTKQVLNESKTVTRRFGWWFLRSGDVVWAVEKAMGLRRGETISRLKLIEIVSTRAEPLNAITKDDCVLEGFPDFGPSDFVSMMCRHYRCRENEVVNRILFKYLHLKGGRNEQRRKGSVLWRRRNRSL